LVRTDNLSAATHELRDSRGRAMNARYEAVLAHYGLEATRTNPLSSHENGVVEQGHRRLKHAMEQALILRGSRDFVSQEEYEKLLRRVMERRNRLVRARMEQDVFTCDRCRRLPFPKTSTTGCECGSGAPSA